MFSMAAALALRTDFTAGDLRRHARQTRDANQARRLLALATVYEGDRAAGPAGFRRRRYVIPLAFTIVMTMLPSSKHAIGLAGFAVTATFAPAIGPTIGGYFTDNYAWPWIFYVNLVPGAVMLAALWYGLPKSAMQFGLLRQGDWRGIALMAVGLTALQTVLDDGNVYDWFGSPFIVKLSLVAAVALGAFVMLEFITPQPLVNLRLLGRRNYGLGTLDNFLLGFALYGSAYLQPQYLAVAQGFDSEQAGEVIAWTGLPQLLLIPLVPL
jgi:DHA2 family multidrug resistance protein